MHKTVPENYSVIVYLIPREQELVAKNMWAWCKFKFALGCWKSLPGDGK